jgi:hypothetical protein
MSDEHEIGFPFPNPQAPGLPPRCDASVEDVHKRDSYDRKGINIDTAFAAVKKLKGDMPVKTHAFVNITKEDLFKRNSKNANCLFDSLGYGYFEMVAKTNGVLFSIQDNKAEGMARCGKVIRESLELTQDFKLSKPAEKVDASTIIAAVDGSVTAHTYKADINTVHLDNAGRAESVVEIRHCEPDGRVDWNLSAFGGQAAQYAVTLGFKTAEYATSGKVLYGTSAESLSGEIATNGVTTDHVATVDGLSANTLYFFQAVARDEFGVEKRSGVISVRTLPDWQISAFSGQASRNSASLTFQTAQYPTVGKIRYGLAPDALSAETAEGAARTNHGFVVNGLNANTVYYFQAVARDEHGLTRMSQVISLRTQPDWGIVGFAGEPSRTSLRVNWATPEYNTVGRVKWGQASDALVNETAEGPAGTNHSVEITGLTPNTVYYIQAVNRDEFGLEKESVVSAVRTQVDWNITDFSGVATETTVTLNWNTSEYATSGKVFWGTTAESLGDSANSAAVGTSHSVTATGLSSDTVYYFQAQSQDEFGLVKRSGVVAIRTEKEVVVPPPLPEWEITDLSGVADTTSVTVGWKTNDYATMGTVLYGLAEDSLNQSLNGNVAETLHVYNVTGLSPDTVYYFQVVSRDEYNQEQRSPIVAVRTLEDGGSEEPPPIEKWEIKGFDGTTTTTSADIIWQTPGAETKATLKVGTSPDNLSLQSIDVTNYAETHLVPVNGLQPNTSYYFQVIAVDKAGKTMESVILHKRTKTQ